MLIKIRSGSLKSVEYLMKHLRKLLLPLVVLMSWNVNAAFILNDDNNKVVNPFIITESFADFYGYAEAVRASSNTGYEEVDSAIFMITQFQNQFSLIATFGAFVADGDLDGGKLKLEMTNEGFANFLFVDDPSEVVVTNGNVTSINFNYIANRTDGFILDLGNGTDVELSFLMSQLVGLDTFKFLNAGGSEYDLGPQFDLSLFNGASVSTPVSEPNGIFLLVLSAVIGLSVRRKRTISARKC